MPSCTHVYSQAWDPLSRVLPSAYSRCMMTDASKYQIHLYQNYFITSLSRVFFGDLQFDTKEKTRTYIGIH
jgi:hypothetical protein